MNIWFIWLVFPLSRRSIPTSTSRRIIRVFIRRHARPAWLFFVWWGETTFGNCGCVCVCVGHFRIFKLIDFKSTVKRIESIQWYQYIPIFGWYCCNGALVVIIQLCLALYFLFFLKRASVQGFFMIRHTHRVTSHCCSAPFLFSFLFHLTLAVVLCSHRNFPPPFFPFRSAFFFTCKFVNG